jgi:hypothetical protein
MMLTAVQPGLVHVRYDSSEEVSPEHQGEVLAMLREELRGGATAIVFDLQHHSAISSRVPNWWLDVLTALGPDLCAMAVVSRALVVRALTGAFAMSCTLRKWALKVEVFDTPADADEWARARLAALRRTRALGAEAS